MIIWPEEQALREQGRRGLALFRETSACNELEASEEEWRVVAWPWTDEPPVRVVLENPQHDARVFSLDEDGIWQMAEAPLAVKPRSADALAADARGDLGDRPLQPAHDT